MAKLPLTEVSKRFNVSRSTIYRAIKEGRLSRGADHQFDLAEVIRCFGEPSAKRSTEEIHQKPIKDDADLRQLVDFMKREIESYKEREQRYLDQIDRFQLLLGHNESMEKVSHDIPLTHPNETPCDNSENIDKNNNNQSINIDEVSHDTPLTHPNETPRNNNLTHNETRKKRGLFGRVLNAVFDNE